MSSPASGMMEKVKQMMGPVLDKAAYYIDNYPIITGLALLAISVSVILSMQHIIDSETVMTLGLGAGIPMGIGILGLSYWLTYRHGKGKSTYLHTNLKKTIVLVTALGLSLLAAVTLSSIGAKSSFFDNPGISNIPIFAAVLGIGVLGSSVLLAQCRNRLYRKVVTTIGTLGYIASIIWVMKQFYIQENPYGAAISSILLFPAVNLIQNMILTWRSDDKEKEEQAVQMARRREPRAP